MKVCGGTSDGLFLPLDVGGWSRLSHRHLLRKTLLPEGQHGDKNDDVEGVEGVEGFEGVRRILAKSCFQVLANDASRDAVDIQTTGGVSKKHAIRFCGVRDWHY